MTIKSPWIPRGTWYMAAVVCALGCDPDQFVSMGSDGPISDNDHSEGNNRVAAATAAAGSTGTLPAESPESAQLDEPPVDPAPVSSPSCAVNPWGVTSSPSPAPGVSAGGQTGAGAAAGAGAGGGEMAGTAGAGSFAGAAGMTSEWVSMPLKL